MQLGLRGVKGRNQSLDKRSTELGRKKPTTSEPVGIQWPPSFRAEGVIKTRPRLVPADELSGCVIIQGNVTFLTDLLLLTVAT